MPIQALPASGRWWRAADRLWLWGVIPWIGSIGLMLWYWPGSLPLDIASGVWTALAHDFAHGIFYRPLVGVLGFGGTRYMPLFFVLHGTLMRWFTDPVRTGVALTVASLVAWDVALYAALRAGGVPRRWSVPLAMLSHATVSIQLLTLEIKGDLLAAALNLAGVALALRYVRRPSRAGMGGAVVAFALAWTAKLTALGTAAAAWAGLVVAGRRRAALALAALLGGVTLALAAGLFGTSATARASFLAVASGGSRPGYALLAPYWFLVHLIQDPFAFLIVGVAGVSAVRRARSWPWSFEVAYFLVVLLGTCVIFASPGADNNHFLDLLGASLLLVGADLLDHEGRRGWAVPARLLPVTLAALTIVTWLPGVPSPRFYIAREGRPNRARVTALVRRWGAASLLSENPLLPILGGVTPRVLDPFSLRVLASHHPTAGADFDQSLVQQRFGAVVLVDYSRGDSARVGRSLRACRTTEGSACYGETDFPSGFLDLLQQGYVLRAVQRPFLVFGPSVRVARAVSARGPGVIHVARGAVRLGAGGR